MTTTRCCVSSLDTLGPKRILTVRLRAGRKFQYRGWFSAELGACLCTEINRFSRSEADEWSTTTTIR